MKPLHAVALTAVLTVVAGLAVLLPQDHASAADGDVTIRALVDSSGNVIIQLYYAAYDNEESREQLREAGVHLTSPWVTRGVIEGGTPEDGKVFQHGIMSLAVEFIPEFRSPLPPVAGYETRFQGGHLPDEEDCYVVEPGWSGGRFPGKVLRDCAVVTCEWGFRVVLGPYYYNYNRIRETSSLGFLNDGMWALGACFHGRLLREGGLENPSGMITIDEFRASIAAALARAGETRPLEAIPRMGTDYPIFSETTYVDFRVLRDGETISVAVQARGGGTEQIIELGEPATIGIYSLAQR